MVDINLFVSFMFLICQRIHTCWLLVFLRSEAYEITTGMDDMLHINPQIMTKLTKILFN